MLQKVRLLISGKVQGVFFRAETKKKADALKLTGWVRNLPTGEVEAYIQGGEKDVAALVEWCHRGPPRAVVSSVQVVKGEPLGQFKSFEVID